MSATVEAMWRTFAVICAGGLLICLVMVVVESRRKPTPAERVDTAAHVEPDVWLRTAAIPVVPSNHRPDCAEPCCWEERLSEMEAAFDWGAAERDLSKGRRR